MFETVTYKVERFQKLKKLEDRFFEAVFLLFGGYRLIQRMLPWADPFRGRVERMNGRRSTT